MFTRLHVPWLGLVSHPLDEEVCPMWKHGSNPKIKGPDNPTCQLLPISSQVKMGWERQEREKRWWRIGMCKKCMSK